MGIGAWGPSTGHEGFTIEADDFDSEQLHDLRSRINEILQPAGVERCPARFTSDSGIDGMQIAHSDSVRVAFGQWGSDVFVDIAPADGFDAETLADGHYEFYDSYLEAIMPVKAETIREAQSTVKDLLVGRLLEEGYHPRYKTSGYTSERYNADPDFNAQALTEQAVKANSAMSLAEQMRTLITEGVGRKELIQNLASFSVRGNTFGGLVAFMRDGELLGVPLGLGGTRPTDQQFVKVVSLQHLAERIPDVIASIEDVWKPSEGEVVRVGDKWLPAIAAALAEHQMESAAVSSRAIPLLVMLTAEEADTVMGDVLVNVTGWDESTDFGTIDNMTFDDYSELMAGNLLDEPIEGDLESMAIDLSISVDLDHEMAARPAPGM